MQRPLATAFTHRCPVCDKGTLYAGMIKLVEQCSECGQSYGNEDVGDGAAYGVILVMGFLVTGLAAVVDIMFTPPMWLHAVLWIPLTLFGSLWLLRVFKSYLVALQLHTRRFD